MTTIHRDQNRNGNPAHHPDSHPDDHGPDAPDTSPAEATPLELAAERALLGAMMTPLHVTRDGVPEPLSSPAIIEARRILAPEHFYLPRHQAIATAIFTLADTGAKGVDPVMVGAELAGRDLLTKVGGALSINALMSESVTTTNAGYHADLIRRGANRRASYAYALRVAQLAAGSDSTELFERVTALHERYVADVTVTNTDVLAVGNRADLLDGLVERWGLPDETGMTTGILDLDDVLNIAPGSVVIVAGRPGSGKSMLVSQIAGHYITHRGEPVLYFSLEMGAAELVERDLARMARIRLDTASGKTPLTDRDRERLTHAHAEYSQLSTLLFYDDADDLDWGHVEARYEEVRKITGPPALVVVDYVQLMRTNTRAERRDIAIGEISRRAKTFAKRTGAIVVLVAQLNRGPESRPDGMPQVSDLRESGSLEQDADAVILVHPVADFVEERAGEIDLIIGKQRRGGNHLRITVGDARPYAAFRDLAKIPTPPRWAQDMPDLDQPDPPTDGRAPGEWWNK